MPAKENNTKSNHVTILVILFNSLTTLAGVFFFGWNADQVICYYWMEIWILAFYNIFKAVLIARAIRDSFLEWFLLIMFGVIGIGIANIGIAFFVSPDFSVLSHMGPGLLLLFSSNTINFVSYALQKQYLNGDKDILNAVAFANKAAVSLIFIPVCDFLKSLAGTNEQASYTVLALIAVRTFFDMRGGFIPISKMNRGNS